jgi:hypothetical protein
VPSAEQIDNRRRGRPEDRIPQIAQDRIGRSAYGHQGVSVTGRLEAPQTIPHVTVREGGGLMPSVTAART